jgi:cation:H+ antiporter
MTLYIAAILAGLAVLIWSADRFITGSAALAANLGVSPLLIGLTVVGFGTSAPEILVSAVAALQDNPGLAIGNALGSNIANIGLILGATALLVPLSLRSATLRREYPLVLAVSFVAGALMLDGTLGRGDGLTLLACLLLLLGYFAYGARHAPPDDPLPAELQADIPANLSTRRALALLLVGLAALLASSKALVWGASEIALAFGISELVVGLTIVAVGTSLPELAASVTSALKGEDDIAIGNVLGSNLYNLLAVLPVPALLSPGAFDQQALSRDIPVMIGFTLAIFLTSLNDPGPSKRISRVEGGLLLCAFLGYQSYLYMTLK